MYYLAAFRSRSQTMSFWELLKLYSVNSKIVNTPREAGAGCGISVQFAPSDFEKAKQILASRPLTAFAGWFSVNRGAVTRVWQ